MNKMLKLAMQPESLSVCSDQLATLTPARIIANVTALALQQVLILLPKTTKSQAATQAMYITLLTLVITTGISLLRLFLPKIVRRG